MGNPSQSDGWKTNWAQLSCVKNGNRLLRCIDDENPHRGILEKKKGSLKWYYRGTRSEVQTAGNSVWKITSGLKRQ